MSHEAKCTQARRLGRGLARIQIAGKTPDKRLDGAGYDKKSGAELDACGDQIGKSVEDLGHLESERVADRRTAHANALKCRARIGSIVFQLPPNERDRVTVRRVSGSQNELIRLDGTAGPVVHVIWNEPMLAQSEFPAQSDDRRKHVGEL